MNEFIFYVLNSLALHSEKIDIFFVFCAEYAGYFLVLIFLLAQILQFYFSIQKEFSSRVFKTFFLSVFLTIFSTLLSWVVFRAIKYLYFSPRPFIVLEQINVLFTHGNYDSFPSGHTLFFFSFAFANHYFGSKFLSPILFPGALLVAISRIAAGVHWPTDILGGIMFAFLGIWTIDFLIKKLKNKKIAYFDGLI